MFFRFLLLNISSVKELLNKPSEIQRNISGALPGKLKRKIFFWEGGALSYKIIPPEITRMPCCFGSNNQGRIYMSRYNICSDQVLIIWTTNRHVYMPLLVCEKTFVATEMTIKGRIYMSLAFKGFKGTQKMLQITFCPQLWQEKYLKWP